jgi:hypothetical protein
LSINQTKLSGQCGRLKCCLNFELDTYLDALQNFPDYADSLDTAMGTAHLIKKDIFKNLMWYILPNNSKHYPLTIQRVKEIKRLNGQGVKVDELQAVEVTSSKPKEVEPAFADVVGQISLRSLERNDKRRRDNNRDNRGDNRGPNNRSNNNGPRPNNNGPRPDRGPNNNGPRPNNNGPRPDRGPNNGPRPNNNGPRPDRGPNNGPRPNNNGPRPAQDAPKAPDQ